MLTTISFAFHVHTVNVFDIPRQNEALWKCKEGAQFELAIGIKLTKCEYE